MLLGCGSLPDEGDKLQDGACRATLLTDSAPWLHYILPDPEGGYVGVGNAAPGANHAFYRLNDRFEIEREVRLSQGDEVPYGFWRWGARYVIGGRYALQVVDRNGEVLASRDITASPHASTGVHGVVPREKSLLVLWSSFEEGLHLDEMDEHLETLRSSPGPVDVCCDISLHGNEATAFIIGKLYSPTAPLWYYPITPQLEVRPQHELLAEGTEHLSSAAFTAQGQAVIATANLDGGVRLRRYRGTSTAGGIALPGSSGSVGILPDGERILVYTDLVDNRLDHPVRVWSVAPDFTEVRGPFTYGRSVDVVYVEETSEDSFRVLAHRHGVGNYDELWLFEGRGCTDTDWRLLK